MIYRITGELVLLEPVDAYYTAVVECSGIAYALKTTFTTASECVLPGQTMRFYTYLYVREDALELFGFAQKEELDDFKLLLSVSGVGPKAALSILSGMTPAQFALAVASGDSKALTRCKGIGAKSAQRIVLELKDKVGEQDLAAGVRTGGVEAVPLTAGNIGEAVGALVSLGYTKAEASQALAGTDPATSVEDLIKTALRQLNIG